MTSLSVSDYIKGKSTGEPVIIPCSAAYLFHVDCIRHIHRQPDRAVEQLILVGSATIILGTLWFVMQVRGEASIHQSLSPTLSAGVILLLLALIIAGYYYREQLVEIVGAIY
jgi:hypothetical protein